MGLDKSKIFCSRDTVLLQSFPKLLHCINKDTNGELDKFGGVADRKCKTNFLFVDFQTFFFASKLPSSCQAALQRVSVAFLTGFSPNSNAVHSLTVAKFVLFLHKENSLRILQFVEYIVGTITLLLGRYCHYLK